MKIFKCSFSRGDTLRVDADEDSVAVTVNCHSRHENVVFLKPADARALAVELVRRADKIDGGGL